MKTPPKAAEGKRLPPPPPRPWRTASFSFSDSEKGTASSEKKREDALDTRLEAIYMGDKDKKGKAGLDRLDRRPTRGWLPAAATVAVVACVLAGSAWGLLVVWNPFRSFTDGALTLHFVGPSNLTIGEETTYLIEYANQGPRTLTDVVLRAGLPSDFQLLTTDPPQTSTTTNTWELGRIDAGQNGRIIVRGVVLGALGTTEAMQLIGTYREAGVATDRDALATLPVTYADTVLQGIPLTTSTAVAGDPVTVAYHIKNHGHETLDALVARVTYPAKFVPDAASGTSGMYEDIPLAALVPDATATVAVTGTFNAGVSGEQPFTIEVGKSGMNGAFTPLFRDEMRVPVLDGDLSLHVVVNGSDTDRTIRPGDSLHIAIGYQDTSPETLKNVAFSLAFESIVNGTSATGTSLLDWSQFASETMPASSTKTRVQTVSYDETAIPALKALAPQDEGSIELSLPTVAAASGTRDAAIRLLLTAEIGGVGKEKVRRTLKSQPILLTYRTDATLLSEARAFTEEGAPLGFGPLPPVAGKTTAYRIFWKVEKRLHALEGMTVEAELPKIASWSGKTEADAGEITYDESSRTVRWTLNEMPADVDALEANFEVQLTPEAFDVGRFAQLLGDTRLEAKDAAVQEPVLLSRPALSTDLAGDDAARGKGVVRATVK